MTYLFIRIHISMSRISHWHVNCSDTELVFLKELVEYFDILMWVCSNSYVKFDIAMWKFTCACETLQRSLPFIKWKMWHNYVRTPRNNVILFTFPCHKYDIAMSQWHSCAYRFLVSHLCPKCWVRNLEIWICWGNIFSHQ